MRYNVGDKVLDISCIDWLGDEYYNEEGMFSLIQTVKSANKFYFSVFNDVDVNNSVYKKQQYINYQLTGLAVEGICGYLHLENDQEKIIKLINQQFENKRIEEKKLIKKNIKSIEQNIDQLNKILVQLMSNKRINFLGKFNFDWLFEQQNKILDLLNFNYDKSLLKE